MINISIIFSLYSTTEEKEVLPNEDEYFMYVLGQIHHFTRQVLNEYYARSYKLLTIDSNWPVSRTMHLDEGDLSVSIGKIPGPAKSNDVNQLAASKSNATWFVSSVTVNGIKFEDQFQAKDYIDTLFD